MTRFRTLSWSAVAHDPGRWLAIGVCLLMGLLLLTQIGQLMQDKTQVAAITADESRQKAHPALLDANSALFRQALFGDYVPDLATAEIKQSTLDFKVVGILYSRNKEASQVLLQAAGGNELLYSVGDTLPGGAVIRQIEKSRIIVLYKGSLESLRLPKNELLFEPPPKPLIEE